MVLNSGSGWGILNRGILRDFLVVSSRPYGTFRLSNLYPGLRPGLSSAVPPGLDWPNVMFLCIEMLAIRVALTKVLLQFAGSPRRLLSGGEHDLPRWSGILPCQVTRNHFLRGIGMSPARSAGYLRAITSLSGRRHAHRHRRRFGNVRSRHCKRQVR